MVATPAALSEVLFGGHGVSAGIQAGITLGYPASASRIARRATATPPTSMPGSSGTSWLWPLTRPSDTLFASLFSSPVGRWAILKHSVFVERFLSPLMARKLSSEELDRYRAVQPTPGTRVGIAGSR